MDHTQSSNYHSENPYETDHEEDDESQSEVDPAQSLFEKTSVAGHDVDDPIQPEISQALSLFEKTSEGGCEEGDGSQPEVNQVQSHGDIPSESSQYSQQWYPAAQEPYPNTTKKTKDLTKPWKFSGVSKFFASKRIMRLVFGEPFFRMSANPHYTFSWKQLLSFGKKSKIQYRNKVGGA